MYVFLLLMTVAASAAATGQPVVEVFLPPANVPSVDVALFTARSVVNDIYAGIGVRVVWRPAFQATSGCSRQNALHRTIVVSLRAKAPAGSPPDTMASSKPYSLEGPCVTLLMDRITGELNGNPRKARYLLGHVMAHEIGHVLQGVARHSETGLMKGHWSTREIDDMPQEPLRFTAHDADLIHLALGAHPAVGADDNENMLQARAGFSSPRK